MWQTDARGQLICLYYDPLNRLLGKHYRPDDSCPTSPTYYVSYSTNHTYRRTGSMARTRRTGKTDNE